MHLSASRVLGKCEHKSTDLPLPLFSAMNYGKGVGLTDAVEGQAWDELHMSTLPGAT